MTREVQQRTKPSQLPDKAGTLLTEPTSIAKALQDHWANIMKEGPKTVEEGLDFRDSLPLPRTLCSCSKHRARRLEPLGNSVAPPPLRVP